MVCVCAICTEHTLNSKSSFLVNRKVVNRCDRYALHLHSTNLLKCEHICQTKNDFAKCLCMQTQHRKITQTKIGGKKQHTQKKSFFCPVFDSMATRYRQTAMHLKTYTCSFTRLIRNQYRFAFTANIRLSFGSTFLWLHCDAQTALALPSHPSRHSMKINLIFGTASFPSSLR